METRKEAKTTTIGIAMKEENKIKCLDQGYVRLLNLSGSIQSMEFFDRYRSIPSELEKNATIAALRSAIANPITDLQERALLEKALWRLI